MNISTSINQLKRNASSLCRGKRVYDQSNRQSAPEGVVCIGSASDIFTESDPVEIDLNDTNQYENKTFVIYGKNVELFGTMPEAYDYALNMFVDRGNVLLRDPDPSVSFDANGNLGGGINGVYLRGNIFINGLIYGHDGNPFENKLYIHGKFASLNTGLEPTDARKAQIMTLFNNNFTTYGDEISDSFCNGTNCINFNNVFVWQCQLSGVGTDGNSCNEAGDRFKYNPFVIIDSIIPTPLLGS